MHQSLFNSFSRIEFYLFFQHVFYIRLANKQDSSEAVDEVEICESLNVEEVVNQYKCPCRVVSISIDVIYIRVNICAI